MSSLLRYFNVILKLSEEDKSYIAARIKTVTLQPGERWIVHGETAFGVGVVEKGLMKKVERKTHFIRRFFKEGEGFTLVKPEFQWVFVAIEPVTLCYILEEDMEDICRGRRMRLAALPRVFIEKDLIHRDERLDMERQSDPLTRYQLFARRYPLLLLRIPPKELGLYLDISAKMVETLREKRGLKHL